MSTPHDDTMPQAGDTTVEAALERVLARCDVLDPEPVGIMDALGRVLAEGVASDIDVAPFDNSAMDGYAVRADDLSAADDAPVSLRVIDDIPAGTSSELEVGGGEASRIMTGAPLPAGADAVVMVEYTEPGEGDGRPGGTVLVSRSVGEGENVRRQGEEVRAGDTVLAAGETIGPAAIGLLAAAGRETVAVRRRPRVAVISTGDELVPVSERPGPGMIRDTNSYSIAAQVLAAGAVPVPFPRVPDELEATRAAFRRAAAEADFIIASGGVSVGDRDFVKPVLEELGELEFWRVAMRPGNPQTMGAIEGVPFFGLPGNPTSTFVGFEVFVRPALRKMQGFRDLVRPTSRVRLAHDVRKKPHRRYYLRASIARDADGSLVASLSGPQSSALLSAAHRADCLLVLAEGTSEFPAGTIVEAMRLDQEEGTP